MEGNKLEISGKEVADPPHATYKPIPAADDAEGKKKQKHTTCPFWMSYIKPVSEIPLTRPKSLTTSKSTTPEVDGADEKMLPNEEKKISPNSNINAGDVKFVLNEKQNGDAKLDIGEFNLTYLNITFNCYYHYVNIRRYSKILIAYTKNNFYFYTAKIICYSFSISIKNK